MRKNFPLFAMLAVGVALALSACSEATEPVPPTFKTSLKSDEIKNSAFKSEFPLHYETYLRNNESEIMTEYGGSVAYNKHDNVNPLPEGYKHAQPYLKNLWLGYAFSYEYRAARGHTYAIKDILNIDRLNRYAEKADLPATCWNCKGAKMNEWVGKYGDEFWAKDFNEFREEVDMDENTIGCANCHDPANMELRLYSVPLQDHLKAEGKDPEQIYEYYTTHGDTNIPGFEGNFVDWIHPVSQTPMLKAQHPEYETWHNGVHGAAGVSCADCHMSYTRLDGKKKMSNHHWNSPLKDPDMKACRQCHTDKTPDYLKQRVIYTQDKVWQQLMVAQDTSVKAHEAIRMASEFTGEKPADYERLMIDARQMCRKGQFFWDLVSAENSVGFHNPTKALDTLAKSQQYSQKAVDIAIKAAAFTTAEALSQDIKELVPPIMEHSRELQMDPEHMASHKWFRYLKVTPKAEQIWDENRRIKPVATAG